jgi:exoribonuclease R
MLADGLVAICRQYQVPGAFPPEVEAAAAEAARRPVAPGPGRRDARDLDLVTLDPAGATDLDQAFALALDDTTNEVILSYAIADVGFFVDRGGVIEAEALKRGSTIYLPTTKVTQYPPVISEDAGSLLPDRDRPSVLLTVAVAADGRPTLRNAEHVVVRSRAQLAYEDAGGGKLPELLAEIARRIFAAEDERGANRVELPEQEVEADASVPGGLRLRTRPRNESEDRNSALSLAANLAVADHLLAARTGLFRVMPEPSQGAIGMLHHVAHALGVAWPKGVTLRQLDRRLDPGDPKQAAFLLAARRAGGGATYAPYTDGVTPWHAAVAATYAHATAPLRRLADRYVLDTVASLFAAPGTPLPVTAEFLGSLPEMMEKAETIQSHVDHAVVDLVEATTKASRVGEVFDATVVDAERDRNVVKIQIADPAVWASVKASAQPGDHLRVRLVSADPAARQVRFEVASG